MASATSPNGVSDRPAGPSSLTVSDKHGGVLGDRAPALQALDLQRSAKEGALVRALWICEGCFKYIRTYAGYRTHKKACTFTHPPGRKVYQRGAHTIWEVDGAKQKLYAQNLSLFGKLFIDHKTIYFDVEPFRFYVLTDASPQFDHVLGFFSKEKISYDDYNLACIMTIPPAQKQGFGTLMIEFSYYLSSLTTVLGTPERPLSDLGLQGYLSFWSSVALRGLALIFNDPHPDIRNRLLPMTYDTDPSARSKHHAHAAANHAALAQERIHSACLQLRYALLGLHHTRPAQESGSPSAKKSFKGWAGEIPVSRGARLSEHSDEEQEQKHPLIQTESGHPQEAFTLEVTLDQLAHTLNLRPDDLCLAMAECGLLRRRVDVGEETQEEKGANGLPPNLVLAITRDLVREAIWRLDIKRPVFDINYARL